MTNKNSPASHLTRIGWNRNFSIDFPEDISLAIANNLDKSKIPNEYLELYYRLYHMGIVNHIGSRCVLMASVVRRILRLHGHPASLKQMVLYWENDRKGHRMIIGGHSDFSPEGEIDAHVVVTCNNYILDFSTSPLFYSFGVLSPRAIIANASSDLYNEYQDLGELHGKVSYTQAMPQHPILKHWRFDQKAEEMEIVKEYFKQYQYK